MESQVRKRDGAAKLILVTGLSLALTGCGRSYYMSESDAAVVRALLQTPVTAGELFSNLHDYQVQLQFNTSSGVPAITNTGYLRDTLCNLADLAVYSSCPPTAGQPTRLRQIDLDRMGTQLENVVNAWLLDRLTVLQDAAGSQVTLTSLSSVTVIVTSAPSFSYDAQHSVISFNAVMGVTLAGSINVHAVSGLDSFISSIFRSNPNGPYNNISVNLNPLTLHGTFTLSNPYAEVARVTLHVDPPATAGPLQIMVENVNNGDVQNGIQQVFQRQLSSPVDEFYDLTFDNFSLSNLQIQAQAGSNVLNYVYHPLPRNAEPLLDLVARGSDSRLHQTQKRNGTWGGFTVVPLPQSLETDPALAASGPDQLELAGVVKGVAGGSILYASRRDGLWGNVFNSNSQMVARPPHPVPYAFATPALVATAPGQVEIVAPDTSGAVWHLRRLNGAWLPPAQIPGLDKTAPVHAPVMLRADNRLLLMVTDSHGQLRGEVFDLEHSTWLSPGAISTTSIQFAPAAAACGDGLIDVVYVQADGAPIHRVLALNDGEAGFSASPPTLIGGKLNAPPALVCSGYNQLELYGRGTDNQYYHNHFVGRASPQGSVNGVFVQPGWQGWQQVTNAFFGTIWSGKVDGPVTLTASRAGEVHAVALDNGATPDRLLYNVYEAKRYGSSAWAAVGWRGFEEVPSTGLAGIPALAIWDQQLELGAYGNNGILQVLRLADPRLPEQESLSGASTEPVVLSSAPGVVDVINLTSGFGVVSLSHHRLLNSNLLETKFMPPAGDQHSINIIRQAAVTNGAGQIDVVGVGDDRSMYHWRFMRGQWLKPSLIPFTFRAVVTPLGGARGGRTTRNPPPRTVTLRGQVNSDPMLISTGAGQLELFAVSSANLYHWRFVNGAWTEARPVTTGFTVNARYLGQRSASTWGDGTVDFIVASDTDGSMYHARMLPGADDPSPAMTFPIPLGGGTPYPVFSPIGGKTVAAPALTAFSPSRLSLLATGTDTYLSESWATPWVQSSGHFRVWTPGQIAVGANLVWSSFAPLCATPIVQGGAARLNDLEEATLAATPDGRLFLNRSLSGRWLGFSLLPGQATPINGQLPFLPVLTIH